MTSLGKQKLSAHSIQYPLSIRIILFSSGSSAIVANEALSKTQNYLGYLAKSQELNAIHLEKVRHIAGDIDLSRNLGVNGAWKQEKLLVDLGGGTRNWTAAEKSELITSGKVRNIQGHHVNSVVSRPDIASNRDNIVFKTRSEHLESHGGDWQNPTEGELQSRNNLIAMKVKHNIIRNELFAGAIVFGIGTIVGFITSYINNPKVKPTQHIYTGIKTGGLMAISYASGRTATYLLGNSPLIASLKNKLAEKFGEDLTKKMTGRITAGIGISIALSFITYFKLRRAGRTSYYAASQAIWALVSAMTSIIVTTIVSGMVESALTGGLLGSVAGLLGTIIGIITGVIIAILLVFIQRLMENKQSRKLLNSGMEGRYMLASGVK